MNDSLRCLGELAHLVLRHSPSTLMFAPDGIRTLRLIDVNYYCRSCCLTGRL